MLTHDFAGSQTGTVLCNMADAHEMRFRTWTRGSSPWTDAGESISSTENLTKIRRVLEHVGCVIIEHWHYHGSRAPERMVFEDYADFIEYLKQNASAGDAIDIWSMHELCKPENRLAEGKCPDEDGRVPAGGAY